MRICDWSSDGCSSDLREDSRARKVLGRPTHLLRRCPRAARQAGKDDRIEMPERVEQPHRLGHQRKRAVETGGIVRSACRESVVVFRVDLCGTRYIKT